MLCSICSDMSMSKQRTKVRAHLPNQACLPTLHTNTRATSSMPSSLTAFLWFTYLRGVHCAVAGCCTQAAARPNRGCLQSHHR